MIFSESETARTSVDIGGEIYRARARAHDKHGENSIESVPADDLRWLPILVEEVGELAHEMTYDAQRLVDVHSGVPLPAEEARKRHFERLRAEALDVAAVAVALIAAIDREVAA